MQWGRSGRGAAPLTAQVRKNSARTSPSFRRERGLIVPACRLGEKRTKGPVQSLILVAAAQGPSETPGVVQKVTAGCASRHISYHGGRYKF